jgi:hypothetical protein
LLGVRHARLLMTQGLRDSELVAIEMSIGRAERDDARNEVDALKRVRDRLLGSMPRSMQRARKVTLKQILDAYGFACRPGPRVGADPNTLAAIAAALRGPFRVSLRYGRGKEARSDWSNHTESCLAFVDI